VRVGLFGIAPDRQCPQFANSKSRLEGCLATLDPKLARSGVEIINPGCIDTPEKAREVGHVFRRAVMDKNFPNPTTHGRVSTVWPEVCLAKVSLMVSKPPPKMAIDHESFHTIIRYRIPTSAQPLVHIGNALGEACY